MAAKMKLWIYFMKVIAKHYILWRLTWTKAKNVNKLELIPDFSSARQKRDVSTGP